MTPNDLSERLMGFAADVGLLCEKIPDTRLGRHIAGQIVRSATSPAPNYEEARAAESRGDFIHKMSISLKELRESRCWLRMLDRAQLVPLELLRPSLDECDQLCNILGQSINTARENDRRREKGAAPANVKCQMDDD
ncbi:MAG TPA: four helix bundle protein [Armatimonadota bacterium]|jgi:four helix bundle protein